MSYIPTHNSRETIAVTELQMQRETRQQELEKQEKEEERRKQEEGKVS